MSDTAYERKGQNYNRDFQIWLRQNAGDNGEQLQRLRRNLRLAREQELTDRQSIFLQLYYDQGLTVTEIARQQGISKSSVSRTISRGRARLKRCLQYSL